MPHSKKDCAASLMAIASKYMNPTEVSGFILEHENMVKRIQAENRLISLDEATAQAGNELLTRLEKITVERKRNAAYSIKKELETVDYILKEYPDKPIEGFNAFLLKPEYLNNLRRGLFFDRNNERHVAFKATELIGITSPDGLTTLNWKIPMEIVYNRKRATRPIFMDAPYPYTILIPKGLIQVTSAGDLMNPYSIEMRGEMSKIGMADLLPLDFDITQP